MILNLRLYLLAGILCGLSPEVMAQSVEDGVAPQFATSETCADCHKEAMSRWRGSHHAGGWRTADDETVLGDFEDAIFEHRGVITRFTRHGGAFLVETLDGEGQSRTFEVIGTAGIAPLQQYLVETEPGRVQVLDVAWDDINRRWYHLYPDLDLGYKDGLHWTGPYKNWNARCAECHATGFEKNYALRSRLYTSTQAETAVGCEACHGPGEAHVAWAGNPAAFEQTAWRGVNAHGLTVAFKSADAEAEIQQCAGCHSRREPLGSASPLPGTPFQDAYRLALLRDGLYHPDGQIRDEVYVYGSFLQSRMYAGGVRCSNCHEPHSGALRAAGNAVCSQCHSPAGNSDFPSLRLANYDSAAHHFHEPNSEGAQCKNCHMIERVYMGIDGRRDHSFRIPRPDLSVSLGTPNACTDCHVDQTDAWAAAEVAARFPNSTRRSTHFAAAFAAAWRGNRGVEIVDLLLEIASSDDLPGIVRASALDTLARYASPKFADQTKSLLQDREPLVRSAAIRLQRAATPAMRLRRIAPLLKDTLKSVRIEAARALLDLSGTRLPPELAASARSAMLEYQQSLIAKADFPEGQMAIAGTALTSREFTMAESAFAEAVRMDPQLVDAWVMIARLRAAQSDGAGAEEALSNGLRFNPDSALLAQFLNEFRGSEDAE
jgi:predicted CXXCH cytochrome family protein